MKKTINIQKATDFERKQNSSALNNLCFGFYETNIRAVELTMKADGVYCGFTKDEFLTRFETAYGKAATDEVRPHLNVKLAG